MPRVADVTWSDVISPMRPEATVRPGATVRADDGTGVWVTVNGTESLPPAAEVEMRTCPRCRCRYPLTEQCFYRSSGGRWEYCQGPGTYDCHASYLEQRRQARRTQYRGELRFGTEIEFVGDALRVERACQDAGLECRSREYTHETTSYWKIVGDASVVDGGELVSPPLVGDEWAEQVTKACRALRSAEASVNQRCGLHVHLEVRGFRGYAIRRVYTAWYENQSLIHQLVSPSRRNGRFCVDIDRFDLDTLRERRMLTRDEVRHGLTFLERYKAINGQAYPRYGTLEVRLHQGTMSAKKILAWSELCRSIFTWAKETDVPHRHEDLSTFLRTLEQHGLQRRTAAYLLRRARRIRAQEAESEDARSLRAHERAERERVERERAEAAHHAEAARQADERYALERTEREREHLIYDSSFSPSSTFRRDVRVRPPGNPFIASFRDVMRDDGLGS